MLRKTLRLVVLLCLTGCSGTTLDLPAAFSSSSSISVQAAPWRLGSEWEYSDGYGLKVSKIDGPLTTFERLDDPRQWLVRRGFLREDSLSATTTRKLIFEDLPSGAGLSLTNSKPLTYRREFVSGGIQRNHATSWTVEGKERVKVPAGEFDCVILVMRTRNLDDGWTGFERWWFSPKAQNYVRMEYRYGPNTTGSRVLTRLRLVGS